MSVPIPEFASRRKAAGKAASFYAQSAVRSSGRVHSRLPRKTLPHGIGLFARLIFPLALILLPLSCTREAPRSVTEVPPPPALDIARLSGRWEGYLDSGGQKLLIRLDFEVNEKGGDDNGTAGTAALLSVPQQNLFDFPAASAELTPEGTVTVKFPALGAVFTGMLEETAIAGTWSQGGARIALTLSSITQGSLPANLRPQDPVPPFPYEAIAVEFPGGAPGIDLAGTLTLPPGPGPHPACILVSGSGQQNRDQEIFGHRPFAVIADALTREGISVLRYDDRGVGGSGGDPAVAATPDFALDAAAALRFLASRPTTDSDRIGIIGHSEGGLIAAMLAADPPQADWAVLLAAPGLPGDELLLLQNEALMKAAGMSAQQTAAARETNRTVYAIASGRNGYEDNSASGMEARQAAIRRELTRAGLTPDQAAQQTEALLSPWMIWFLRSDPSDYLKQAAIPILALNGSKDIQVPYREHLEAIERALRESDSPAFETVVREGLNHLFQPAETGQVSEYALIDTTFDPETLEIMVAWILKTVALH